MYDDNEGKDGIADRNEHGMQACAFMWCNEQLVVQARAMRVSMEYWGSKHLYSKHDDDQYAQHLHIKARVKGRRKTVRWQSPKRRTALWKTVFGGGLRRIAHTCGFKYQMDSRSYKHTTERNTPANERTASRSTPNTQGARSLNQSSSLTKNDGWKGPHERDRGPCQSLRHSKRGHMSAWLRSSVSLLLNNECSGG